MTIGETEPAEDETSSSEATPLITFEIPAPQEMDQAPPFSAAASAFEAADSPMLPDPAVPRQSHRGWTIALFSGLVVALVCGAIGVFTALSGRSGDADVLAGAAHPSGQVVPRGDGGRSARPEGGVRTVNGHQVAVGLVIAVSGPQLILQLRGGRTLTVTTTSATTVDGAAGGPMTNLATIGQPILVVGTLVENKAFSASAIYVNGRPDFGGSGGFDPDGIPFDGRSPSPSGPVV